MGQDPVCCGIDKSADQSDRQYIQYQHARLKQRDILVFFIVHILLLTASR